MIDSWPLVLFFFWKMCKKFEKKFEKNWKKIEKKSQKICKKIAKRFLLCKIFAKFLQILNLHTDFRPREESVNEVVSQIGKHQITGWISGWMTGQRADNWVDNRANNRADNRVDNWADNRADNWEDNWVDNWVDIRASTKRIKKMIWVKSNWVYSKEKKMKRKKDM